MSEFQLKWHINIARAAQCGSRQDWELTKLEIEHWKQRRRKKSRLHWNVNIYANRECINKSPCRTHTVQLMTFLCKYERDCMATIPGFDKLFNHFSHFHVSRKAPRERLSLWVHVTRFKLNIRRNQGGKSRCRGKKADKRVRRNAIVKGDKAGFWEIALDLNLISSARTAQ